jgi:hypothetical protein
MTKVRPLSKRHNVITGFGYYPHLRYWRLLRVRSYWVMTVITVNTVITLITYIDPQLFWSGYRLHEDEKLLTLCRSPHNRFMVSLCHI